jgi:hypothetical protein
MNNTRTSSTSRSLLRLALLVVPVVLLAAPTAAADTTDAGVDLTGTGGCSVTAVSKDADDTEIGRLSQGTSASSDAPLLVAKDGTVGYDARSEELLTDNEWTVTVAGIPVKSGTWPNDRDKQLRVGTVQIDDYLPVAVTGTMKVEADVVAADGTDCALVTWVRLDGNGLLSANGLLGIGLLAIGLIGGSLSLPIVGDSGALRTHGVRGTIFGLVAGFGLATLLVSTSVIVVGSPWLVLAITLVLGVVGGLVGKFVPARDGRASLAPQAD